MPTYHYKAMLLNGEYVDGELEAENRPDLIQRLQAAKLFLVSAHTDVALNPTAPSVPEEAVPTPPQTVKPLPEITWKRGVLLSALLACGVGVGAWRVYRSTHPSNNIQELNEMVARVKENMSRRDVEKIFHTPYPGPPSPRKTWYFVPPNVVVEIPYKRSGKPGNDQDRAIPAEIRIFIAPLADGKSPRP